jgi:urease accessory protein
MTGAFVGGLIGFLLPTHLLAVVALALMIGQGGRLPLAHVVLFAVGFVIGCFIIATAIRETSAPLLLLGCAAVCGGVVLAAWRPQLVVTAALALIVGILIALNSPPQALTIRAAMVEQVGSAVAALLTLAVIILIVTKATQPWQRIGVRVIGSWIAASAILVLALRLAR